MKIEHIHTAVIGGGILGCAAAISIKRRLARSGGGRVALFDKSVLGAGLTARHSGIVRAANAVDSAAAMAHRALAHWRALPELWGVAAPFDACGAVWIACDTGDGSNAKWDALAARVSRLGVQFSQIDRREAAALCTGAVRLNDDEVFYYEPDAVQFDPAVIRTVIYRALAEAGVEVFEKTPVTALQSTGDAITALVTPEGTFPCGSVVNAAGAWSPALLAPLGIKVPVGVEPVNVVNWLTSLSEASSGMPIIADYVNLAYFRTWRDGEIHMHQPRKRAVQATARAFAENPVLVTGADFINDPTNDGLGYGDIRIYEDIARRRFATIDATVYGSGYRSYFDITPDLRFILGADPRMPNLVHCLGSGQAFKYAPVFGEIMADCVTASNQTGFDISEYSIARFDEDYMGNFWAQVSGSDHSLATESAGL